MLPQQYRSSARRLELCAATNLNNFSQAGRGSGLLAPSTPSQNATWNRFARAVALVRPPSGRDTTHRSRHSRSTATLTPSALGGLSQPQQAANHLPPRRRSRTSSTPRYQGSIANTKVDQCCVVCSRLTVSKIPTLPGGFHSTPRHLPTAKSAVGSLCSTSCISRRRQGTRARPLKTMTEALCGRRLELLHGGMSAILGTSLDRQAASHKTLVVRFAPRHPEVGRRRRPVFVRSL